MVHPSYACMSHVLISLLVHVYVVFLVVVVRICMYPPFCLCTTLYYTTHVLCVFLFLLFHSLNKDSGPKVVMCDDADAFGMYYRVYVVMSPRL